MWEAWFDLDDGPFRVLAALALSANLDGKCWVGQETIARLSKRSVRAVSAHLKTLEEHGWLTVTKRRRLPAIYTLLTGSPLPVKPALTGRLASKTGSPASLRLAASEHKTAEEQTQNRYIEQSVITPEGARRGMEHVTAAFKRLGLRREA